MNSGSRFLREMIVTTSSSSPGGSVSDSTSVTKPCRYFCATSASRSVCGLDMMMRYLCLEPAGTARRRGDGAHGRGKMRTPDGDGFLACQLRQRDLVERAADRAVDALPG